MRARDSALPPSSRLFTLLYFLRLHSEAEWWFLSHEGLKHPARAIWFSCETCTLCELARVVRQTFNDEELVQLSS